jgi:hypothetical protein
MELSMKPSNDREAITLILTGLVEKGHTIDGVIEDTWNKEGVTLTSDPSEAAELCSGVDECFVYLDDRSAYIYFVLGNEPEEVACDYTVNLDPDLSAIVDPWWN